MSTCSSVCMRPTRRKRPRIRLARKLNVALMILRDAISVQSGVLQCAEDDACAGPTTNNLQPTSVNTLSNLRQHLLQEMGTSTTSECQRAKHDPHSSIQIRVTKNKCRLVMAPLSGHNHVMQHNDIRGNEGGGCRRDCRVFGGQLLRRVHQYLATVLKI